MTLINPATDSGGRSPTRVLYVEGDPFVSQVPSRFLASCGCAVTVAYSAEEAWHLYEGRNGYFDVVIADGDSPAMGGIELVSKLRSVSCPVRIIVFMADKSDELASRYEQLGVIEILKKPLSLWDLSECLETSRGRNPPRPPTAF